MENLLKVLKVLKTRTALTRNELAELRISYARQGAKAPFKTKEQNQVTEILQNSKTIEKSKKKEYNLINGRKVFKMRKPRFSKNTIEKLMNGLYVESKNNAFSIESEWNEELKTYEDVLYRVNKQTGDTDRFVLTAPEGIWAFENN